jgi:hypothetical protein
MLLMLKLASLSDAMGWRECSRVLDVLASPQKPPFLTPP